MAFNAEAVARLKLDKSDFDRGLTATVASVGAAGHDINRKLKRAFGVGEVFKGVLMGLGIGSVEHVVGVLTKGWERAAEQARTIAEQTELAAKIYERMFSKMRTPEQNLDTNLRQQARLQRELKETTETSTTRKTWNAYTQRFDDQKVVTREARPERAAEIARELAELAAEEQDLRKQIADAKKKSDDEEAKKADDLAERRNKIAEAEKTNAREQLSLEKQLTELKRDRLAVDYLVATGQITPLEGRERILEIDKQIQKTEKEAATEATRATKERLVAAERLRDVTTRAAEAWMDLQRAKDDRTGITVDEMARGGKGVSQTNKVRAKEIQRLEEQATRQKQQGFYKESEQSAAKAMKLRESLTGLTSAERNPLRGAQENLAEGMKQIGITKKDSAQSAALKAQVSSAASLKNIDANLTIASLSGGTPSKGKASAPAPKKK